MTDDKSKSYFLVYQVGHNSTFGNTKQLSLTLADIPYPHDKHASYSDAKQWIENHLGYGENAILEIIKKD
jgi:hypothetical protein